ncbi:hypothetical protein, partial [Bradyrhizobium sp.]|uniref:hypothetical protein n=1 Tax=Bradyrhizobium sp. TaxID=376 RepID=UPI00391DA3F5
AIPVRPTAPPTFMHVSVPSIRTKLAPEDAQGLRLALLGRAAGRSALGTLGDNRDGPTLPAQATVTTSMEVIVPQRMDLNMAAC